MNKFNARCILFNLKSKEWHEVVITSVEDIKNILTLNDSNSKDKVTQINIDKYNKVYYNSSNLSRGISGWCYTHAEHDEFSGEWVTCEGKDYIIGDLVLLVLCDDVKPIDITDKSKEYMISCLKL